MHKVFDSLQFKVLRERLYATLSTPEPEAEAGFEVEGGQLGPDEVAGWLAEHSAPGVRLALSVAGTLGPWHRCRHRPCAGGSRWRGCLPRPDAADRSRRQSAGRLVRRSPTQPKALHDAKGPLLALGAHGWPLNGLSSDTALAAYLALPGQRSFDLGDLALRYLHRELRAEGAAGRGRSAVARRPRRRRQRDQPDRAGARGARSGGRSRRRPRRARRHRVAH